MIGKAIARSIPPITARISAHTQIAPNATNARKINNNVSILDSFLLLSDVSVQQTPPEFFVSYISSWIFAVNIFKILFAINNNLWYIRDWRGNSRWCSLTRLIIFSKRNRNRPSKNFVCCRCCSRKDCILICSGCFCMQWQQALGRAPVPVCRVSGFLFKILCYIAFLPQNPACSWKKFVFLCCKSVRKRKSESSLFIPKEIFHCNKNIKDKKDATFNANTETFFNFLCYACGHRSNFRQWFLCRLFYIIFTRCLSDMI